MKIKHLLITLLILVGISFSKSTNISGQVEYFYMTRLDNSQLVNIPFRLLDFNIQHQVTDDFILMGNFGIEYRNRRDTDFMEDSNLEDFLLDLRELYMSYYFNKSEVRIGKQIHSWGSVDENSPIDNLNAYDYYYLLLGGSEKKLGAYSLAFDTEIDMFGTSQLSFVYSPMHNTSRIPINDPDYPIGLPSGSSPSKESVVFNDNTPSEMSLNLKWSFNFGDISLSQLSFYDRIFNLSALTAYTNTSGDKFSVYPRYSYRHTDVSNIGMVFLADDFTLSFDHAKFMTRDQNILEDFEDLLNPEANYDPNYPLSGIETTETLFNHAFEETVVYYQTAIQFEMPLENNYIINAQYFKYEIDSYKANEFDASCDALTNLPDFTEADCADIEEELGFSLDDFTIQNLFIPGVGTPYGLITDEGFLFNLEKEFPDYDLTIDISAFLDATGGNGRLLSFEAEYDLGESFEVSIGMTKIFGDDNIENYNFNNMKSFSSFRSRITYYF
tara:strand:+ start:190 stop:1686 length:1497 start_codon:yes stop_codon:yes gene_type:complete